MARRTIIVSLAALALVSSATALAGNGYRVWATAQHRPTTGSVFSVLAHGVSAQKGLVYIYLDNQPCRASWVSEQSKNVSPFKAGQSHFQGTGKALITLSVSGQFSKAFNAIAGTTAEPEHACAYLTIPNSAGQYKVTVARRSNAYFVTG